MDTSASSVSLPDFFRPILWSYDIRRIDVARDRKAIIVQALNYGDLEHWRWLVHTYGKEEIRKVLAGLPMTEFRSRVRRLIILVFSIDAFSHAPRSAY